MNGSSKFIDRIAKAVYDRVYPERGNWDAIGGMSREDFRDRVEAAFEALPSYMLSELKTVTDEVVDTVAQEFEQELEDEEDDWR